MSADSIKIVAISGSVREGNLTKKSLQIVVDQLNAQDNVQATLVDAASLKLALPGQPQDSSINDLKDLVKDATGIILATPEYHGSYSSVIKLIIESLEFPSILAGKPVALLGVASGRIGAIKALEHLRSVCSHIGCMPLPYPISIAGVHNYFDDQGNCTDPKIKETIESVGISLVDFIHNHICPKYALEQEVRGK